MERYKNAQGQVLGVGSDMPIDGSIATVEEVATYETSKAKSSKLIELEQACENQIISGFASSALGTEHWYKSELTDQMNLIGAASIGADFPYKSGVKNANGIITYDWMIHTAAQIKQVMSDGAAYKLQLLQKLTMLKANAEAAIDQSALDAVVW